MPKAIPITPLPKSQRRASSTARGYDHEHRKQRSRILDLHPLCQLCNDAFSTDLHHIDENPRNRDDANVLAVCEVCHHSKIHG